jgi:hypothetical protein
VRIRAVVTMIFCRRLTQRAANSELSSRPDMTPSTVSTIRMTLFCNRHRHQHSRRRATLVPPAHLACQTLTWSLASCWSVGTRRPMFASPLVESKTSTQSGSMICSPMGGKVPDGSYRKLWQPNGNEEGSKDAGRRRTPKQFELNIAKFVRRLI